MYSAETFPVGAFQCNCSILFNPSTLEAIVVDPGDEPEQIIERIEYHNLKVKALWHTHAHIDHIGATKALYDYCEAKRRDDGAPSLEVYLHEGDRWLYENVAVQARFLGLNPFSVTANFKPIVEGQKYELEGLQALHTPGHTPGSCCLKVKNVSNIEAPRAFFKGDLSSSPLVFSGDTLFRRGIGRTDLWGGDSQLIAASIQKKLYRLDPNTLVVPGHGPLTVVEEEMAKNPFVTTDSVGF